MNEKNSFNERTNRIVGLSTLVCLDDSSECYDVGLVSSTGRVNGAPKSRLAGIIGVVSIDSQVPASWLSLHRRANPRAQEVQ
jgi:hypothetical protein